VHFGGGRRGEEEQQKKWRKSTSSGSLFILSFCEERKQCSIVATSTKRCINVFSDQYERVRIAWNVVDENQMM
jgi:hypothetical protein